jgi:fatty-acyl-CoA synthase
MAALTLRPGASFDPEAFAAFLAEQPDLGTKWWPRFVRVASTLPLTATNKVAKPPLRAEGWRTTDPVWWQPTPRAPYEPFTAADETALVAEFAEHGRPLPDL